MGYFFTTVTKYLMKQLKGREVCGVHGFLIMGQAGNFEAVVYTVAERKLM